MGTTECGSATPSIPEMCGSRRSFRTLSPRRFSSTLRRNTPASISWPSRTRSKPFRERISADRAVGYAIIAPRPFAALDRGAADWYFARTSTMGSDGPADAELTEATPPARVSELALLFLRLGFTAFGGPAAHVAIMEDEILRRRRWVSSERFLDLLGVANLIPGPSSTELAILIGYEQAGWLGLFVGGVCFILPAALVVTVLAWAYVRFGAIPQISGILYGIKPVVIAIVVQAISGLAPKAVKKSVPLGVLGFLACVASALHMDAILVLLGGGTASVMARQLARAKGAAPAISPGILGGLAVGSAS